MAQSFQTKTHRLCGMKIGGRIQLVALLWNCYNSFSGSQTSDFFGLEPVPIHKLLAQRHNTMPNFVREC